MFQKNLSTPRKIIQRNLTTTPARFIVGGIAQQEHFHSGSFSEVTEQIADLGEIEQILPEELLKNVPASYERELGTPLATTVWILQQSGAYTDVHFLKKKTTEIERALSQSHNRQWNLNPGAVGRYGVVLTSHKDSGGREDIRSPYGKFNFFASFESPTYLERIMQWDGTKLLPFNNAANGAFPEYFHPERLRIFENLINALPGNTLPLELLER